MKRFKWSALFSALAISFPTAAVAQTTSADQAYLDDLYSFLENQDSITYTMATRGMSAEQNIWAAQMFCQTLSSGVEPIDAYSAYTSAAVAQASSLGTTLTDEMAYAVGLYGGAVMNLGAFHYCPQFQPQVSQALGE